MEQYEILKQLRIQNKMTQQEVADRLGVTKAAISKYETGQRSFDKYARQLADVLGADLSYLLTGKTMEEWQAMHRECAERAEQEDREYWESELLPDSARALIPLLEQLNDEGQAEAVKRVGELAEIPRYRRSF